jgi:hypothetical protein
MSASGNDEGVPLMQQGESGENTMRQRQQKFKAEADAVRERIKSMKFPKRKDYGYDSYNGGGYGEGDYDEPPTMAFYCGLILLVAIMSLLGVVFLFPHWLESAEETFDDGF